MRSLFFDHLGSTNDFLKELINGLSPAPFLGVLTNRQTKGRGRLNRTWSSEKGSSFLYSLLLPDEKKPFHLGFVAAVSAIEVLNKNYSIEAFMKWPNDIYWQNKKLGGILLEKEKEFLILGIGINLNQQIFSDD
ncbi:MAG: biotin--[acetyl-CoA-carboxylase] ligase, partial [Spirochaetes bacterium GWB1_36_13]